VKAGGKQSLLAIRFHATVSGPEDRGDMFLRNGGPEDGGDMFLGNVYWLSTDYTALYPRRYALGNLGKHRPGGRSDGRTRHLDGYSV
jgi:hypothetical protein